MTPIVFLCLLGVAFSLPTYPFPVPINPDNYEYGIYGPYITDGQISPYYPRNYLVYPNDLYYRGLPNIFSWLPFFNRIFPHLNETTVVTGKEPVQEHGQVKEVEEHGDVKEVEEHGDVREVEEHGDVKEVEEHGQAEENEQ